MCEPDPQTPFSLRTLPDAQSCSMAHEKPLVGKFGGLTPYPERTTITQGQCQSDRPCGENVRSAPRFRRFPSTSHQGGSGPQLCPVSLRLQNRVIIGLICFLAFVIVAYLFGILVLNWLQ